MEINLAGSVNGISELPDSRGSVKLRLLLKKPKPAKQNKPKQPSETKQKIGVSFREGMKEVGGGCVLNCYVQLQKRIIKERGTPSLLDLTKQLSG